MIARMPAATPTITHIWPRRGRTPGGVNRWVTTGATPEVSKRGVTGSDIGLTSLRLARLEFQLLGSEGEVAVRQHLRRDIQSVFDMKIDQGRRTVACDLVQRGELTCVGLDVGLTIIVPDRLD